MICTDHLAASDAPTRPWWEVLLEIVGTLLIAGYLAWDRRR